MFQKSVLKLPGMAGEPFPAAGVPDSAYRRLVPINSPQIPIAAIAISPGSGACVGTAVVVAGDVAVSPAVPVVASGAVVGVSAAPVVVAAGAGMNMMLCCRIRPSLLLNAKYRPYLPSSVCVLIVT